MREIPLGTRGERKLLVTSDVAIDFIGHEPARVLSTPQMIAGMEMAARDAVKPLLEEGYDTVGTHVDVKHLAATPIGMSVTFHAEVVSVDDRRIGFRVWAEDEVERIGEGTHERFIVNVERFGARVEAKAGRKGSGS